MSKHDQDGNGFIDHISNHPTLADLEPSELTSIWLGQPVNLPPEKIIVFLHEATHHWSFSSLVGDSMAAVSIKNLITAYPHVVPNVSIFGENKRLPTVEEWNKKIMHGSFKANKQIINFAKVQFARRLLDPITEGLAVFMELDIYEIPPIANIPPPLNWIHAICGSNTQDVNKLLSSKRLHKLRVERRLEYYTSPLNFERGGHLAGYLYLRSLFNSNNCPLFIRDPIIFLTTIKTLFFEDPILSKLLLLDNLSFENFIIEFESRFNSIVTRIQQWDIEEMEKPAGSDKNPIWPVFYSKQINSSTRSFLFRVPEIDIRKTSLLIFENIGELFGINENFDIFINHEDLLQVSDAFSHPLIFCSRKLLLSRRSCSCGEFDAEYKVVRDDLNRWNFTVFGAGEKVFSLVFDMNEEDSDFVQYPEGDCQVGLYFHETAKTMSICISCRDEPILQIEQNFLNGSQRVFRNNECTVFGRTASRIGVDLLQTPIGLIELYTSYYHDMFNHKAKSILQRAFMQKIEEYLPTILPLVDSIYQKNSAKMSNQTGLYAYIEDEKIFSNWIEKESEKISLLNKIEYPENLERIGFFNKLINFVLFAYLLYTLSELINQNFGIFATLIFAATITVVSPILLHSRVLLIVLISLILCYKL